MALSLYAINPNWLGSWATRGPCAWAHAKTGPFIQKVIIPNPWPRTRHPKPSKTNKKHKKSPKRKKTNETVKNHKRTPKTYKTDKFDAIRYNTMRYDRIQYDTISSGCYAYTYFRVIRFIQSKTAMYTAGALSSYIYLYTYVNTYMYNIKK